MPSYNLVNGRPAHLSPLINDVMRGWSDDELLVVSDAGAPANLYGLQEYFPDGVTAHAAALRAGVDSFTQDDSDASGTIKFLEAALERGLITQEDIDRAAARALTLRFRLGEFDPAGESTTAPDIVGCQAHRDLAREAARQAFVLLKNDDLLPLPTDVQRIAVLGPLADTLQEDWYSGTLPYQVTAVKALTERLGPDAVEYCEGADRVAVRYGGSGPGGRRGRRGRTDQDQRRIRPLRLGRRRLHAAFGPDRSLPDRHGRRHPARRSPRVRTPGSSTRPSK